MEVSVTLNTIKNELLDACAAHTLAHSLTLAIIGLLHPASRMSNHQCTPEFSSTTVKLLSKIEYATDFFDSMETHINRLNHAAAILSSAELLLRTSLADRLIMPDARLPVPVVYSPDIRELLEYDKSGDIIKCQAPDSVEVVSVNLKMLKALAAISSAGLTPTLEVDGTSFNLPEIQKTIFSQRHGPGQSKVSNCFVTGLYILAKEIEVEIEGFKDGRVIRAELSDSARLTATEHRPPFTAALRYSELITHMPLLPYRFKNVVIEELWAIEEQTEIKYS